MPKSHGHTVGGKPSPTYVSWKMMIQRCYNKKRDDYRIYGGAGVCVYFDWIGPGGFQNFIEDLEADGVGLRPDESYCLGRKDHAADYEPGNVEWIPIPENCACVSHDEYQGDDQVEVDGLEMTKREWAEHLGITYKSLLQRIRRGWGDDAFRYKRGERRPRFDVVVIKEVR